MILLSNTVDALTVALHGGFNFINRYKTPLFWLTLATLVTGAYASDELMMLLPDEKSSSLICFKHPDFGELAYRIIDVSGVDGLSPNLAFLNEQLHCGLGETASKSEMIGCLEKGLGLFVMTVNGAAHELVEKVDVEECYRQMSDFMRSQWQ